MARANYSFRSHARRAAPQAYLLIALVATAVVGPGCGGGAKPTAHLQGQVTIDGQRLPADAVASITFQTTQPGQGRIVGAPIVDGRYDSPDTPLGPLKAIITVQAPTGRTIDNGRGTPAPEFENIISDEYSTGIDLEVDGDKDDQDFDLKRSEA